MVDPNWRNIRLPNKLLKRRRKSGSLEEIEDTWPQYSLRRVLSDEQMHFYNCDTQGCRSYNDDGIFYDDAIIEVQFPRCKVQRVVRKMNINRNNQSINYSRNYAISREIINVSHEGSVNSQTPACCDYPNIEQSNAVIAHCSNNNIFHMNPEKNSSAACVPSLAGTSNTFQENIASQPTSASQSSKTEKKRRKKQQQRANKRRRIKEEEDEVMVQCKLPKKLLADLIISSIKIGQTPSATTSSKK